MSNQCLQIGELLRGTFGLAKGMRANDWHPEYWETFRKLAKAWIEEFRALEPTFERLPDGWAEMAAIEGHLTMATFPVLLDSEIPEDEKPTWQAKGDQRLVLDAGELWLPLWARLFPAIRGHRAKAPPDGPIGNRGWRHKGKEFYDLDGGDATEAMREIYDKPIGFSIVRVDGILKRLAERIKKNCEIIGLDWQVKRSDKKRTLTKIPLQPKRTTKKPSKPKIQPKPKRGTKKGA